MVYVSHDGTVGGPKSTGRWITDFFLAIYNFFALFFNTVLNPPTVQSQNRRTYAQRNGGRSYNGGGAGNRLGRGTNIRGVGNLQSGNCEAKMGGG